jgi:hypothetical protein
MFLFALIFTFVLIINDDDVLACFLHKQIVRDLIPNFSIWMEITRGCERKISSVTNMFFEMEISQY